MSISNPATSQLTTTSSLSNKMKLTDLKGLGPKREVLFNQLNIFSQEDLIRQLPRKYEDRSRVYQVDELEDQQMQLVKVQLKKLGKVAYLPGRRTIQRAEFYDDSGKVEVVWFNQAYISRNLQIGDSYYLYAVYHQEKNQMINPKFSSAKNENFIGIHPIYPQVQGLNNKFRSQVTRLALEKVDMNRWEILDESKREDLGFQTLTETYESIHFPENRDDLLKSKYELSFRKWFIHEFASQEMKRERQSKSSPLMTKVDFTPYIESLPFVLTGDQKKSILEIEQDLLAPSPMNRLLQGDVGSGKTVVSLAAAYMALGNGYQVALMAPTEVLAQQHYQLAKTIYGQLGFQVVIVTGSSTNEDRKLFQSAAMMKDPSLLIGTHTLFQDGVEFANLGLVIMDEQQRFGVAQRARLQGKAHVANTLILSATPIPRTLSLIENGDLDASIINELPPGRKPIETFVVDRRYEKRMLTFISKELEKGHQAYVVCPRIYEKGSDLDYWSVENVAKRYKDELPGHRLGVLHGNLKAEEKATVLENFRQGNIDLLLSTTVIEVGVDVPNSTLMVICAADRFGLSQLHQLRGRTGRGSEQSYCILIAHSTSKSAIERLRILEQSNDGFIIAKKDLSLRGSGERLGLAQHGVAHGDTFDDYETQAKADAKRFVSKNFRTNEDFRSLNNRLEAEVNKELEKMNRLTLN